MRVKYQDVFVDGNGRVIYNGTITVYLAGTSTLATIYSAESGGQAITGSAVTSGVDGTFEFWVDYSTYKFKLVMSKDQYVTATYDDVFIPGMSATFELSHYAGDGRPAFGEKVLVHVASSGFTAPVNLNGSRATLETAATAETVFQIMKNDVEIGLMTFAVAATTATFTCPVETVFAAGDKLTVKAVGQDDTAAGLAFTLQLA